MPKKLRVGIIGCGEIAVAHAAGVSKTANAEISMTMDVSFALAKDLGDKYNAPATDKLEELLSSKNVDTVYIATPHYLHAPLTIKAAQAGKHVMVEKPLSTNLKDADNMISECKKQGVKLSTCFVLRYNPPVIKAKELIEKGIIGKIIAIEIKAIGDKPVSYWTGGYSGRAKTDWRTSKEKSGGGILIMNASHNIDYLRYITGLEAKRVYSEYGTFATSVEVEDVLFATILYDKNAIGVIGASSCFRGGATTGLKEPEGDKIYGLEGQIVLSNPLQIYTTKSEGFTPDTWQEIFLGQTPDLRQRYVEDFARAVLENKEPPITGEDGRVCLEIITAIYEAGKKHAPVEV
ncbi:Gfo/Idh/MocA family oxidoreductase [candidate division NPL-UPA2 bacterium]|nr:Gfo/Idh/MocA family oxidoreductase [candidate division NPL-UPA2 bacterium]